MATATLRARLTLNDALFLAGIKRATSAAQVFAASVAKMGLDYLRDGMIGVGKGFINGAKHIIDTGDELLRMKRITGLSVSSLFVLREAFEQAGTSAEAIGPSIGKMQKNLHDGAKNGEKFKTSLKGIGIDAKKLMAMKPEDQFLLLAKTIDALPDGQKQAVAMERFGKAGLGLLPVFAELKDFDSTSLQKQAAVIEKNADAFDNANDAIRRMKTNFQGLFAGLATKMAPFIANIGKRLEAIDFVAWGDKISDALMQGVRMGLALFNDPMGTTAYFWDWTKAKALEFGNWLIDAVDGAFPGMGEGIMDAIAKIRAFGNILVGAAMQFGQVLLAATESFGTAMSDAWKATGIPEAMAWMKSKVASQKPGQEMARSNEDLTDAQIIAAGGMPHKAKALAKEPIKLPDNFVPEGWDKTGKHESFSDKLMRIQGPEGGAGGALIEKGMKQLSEATEKANSGLKTFARGTDHLGANAAKMAADLSKSNIAPALAKADRQMAAVGLGPQAGGGGKAGLSWFQQRLAGTSVLKGAGGLQVGSLQGASMLGGAAMPPGGIAPEDWAKMNSKQRNTFMDAAVARGDMTRPNGMIRAGDKRRRDAYEKAKLMERIGVDKTNDILGEINQKLEGLE